MEQWLNSLWYGKRRLFTYLLLPYTWLYQAINLGNQWYGRTFRRKPSPCPVIVVGNLTVGGVGKTPLVIAIIQFCQQQGLKVGVVSRGFGSRSKFYPREVVSRDSADVVGDEPLLIVRKTGAPVFIAPNRSSAVQACFDKYQCDVIISDDGLQHQAMARAIEIVVIDGDRKLGNGFCLPAGPLRDSPRRLKSVDLVVARQGSFENAYEMQFKTQGLVQMKTHQLCDFEVLSQPVTAIAGIGNPVRFFEQLKEMGMDVVETAFSDHHHYTKQEYDQLSKPVVMTEKDAVKCFPFASKDDYFVSITAQLSGSFWLALSKCMRASGVG